MSVVLLTITSALTACGDNSNKEADLLLETIRQQYDNRQYTQTLRSIDSLRTHYPQAIEQRKEALKIYQNTVLTMAQNELMHVDTLLQQARTEYQAMKSAAEAHHQQGTATADELTAVTLQKLKVDSLQNRFDAYVAKVKYIHKKQKED